MSFEVYEGSNYGGKPITYYVFTRGGQQWRYTSADSDQTIAGHTYTAVPIFDSGVVQSGEPAHDAVVISGPWTLPLVGLFLGTPPAQSITAQIFQSHKDDPDQTFQLTWMGFVATVKRTDPGSAQITCSTVAQSFQDTGLRLGWQRTCPYMLYDPATCKAVKADHALGGTVTALTGVSVSADNWDGPPDQAFRGGFIEWQVDTDTFERRAVADHVGPTLTLLGFTDGLSVGMFVVAYLGCNRTVQMCHDVFDNLNNCGAAPTMPGRSPFDGNPVF